MRTKRDIALLAASASGLVLTASFLAGCNIVGPAFYFIHGPEKTQAVHTLDPERTTVVFVDDRSNRIPRRASRLALAERVTEDLLAKRAVKEMISAQSAILAASGDRSGSPMPITEIGQNVKADTVIYVTVDAFGLTADGASYAPFAQLRVKVIDVTGEQRTWPEDPRGHPVLVRMTPRQGEAPQSTAERYQAEDDLAREAGLRIGQLFYKHETPRGVKAPD